MPAPEPPAPGTIQFNEKVKDDFEGLLYLGLIQKTFKWGGHTFRIKTLNSDERLRAAQLCKPWLGTVEEARAWIIATVALSTIAVDGKAVVPLGMDDDLTAESKYAWARQQFPWTIDAIMSEVTDLEKRVEEAIVEMGKAPGSSPTPTSGIALS